MTDPAERSLGAWRRGALLAGCLLTVALVPWSQISGDQLNLLARGWLLAEQGQLIPYGNPLSSGGHGPGAAQSVVVGLPLWLWSDFRAPVVLNAILGLLALLLIDRTLAGALSSRERLAYALLFALGPWRLIASATLWNPNYLILVAAIHLATARALRLSPRFGATVVHVLALGIGAQFHPAVLLLGVTSLVLWSRGRAKPSWSGVAVGVALTVASLLPWFSWLAESERLGWERHGFPFRGLLLIVPLLKGLSYWLRLPSLLVSHEFTRFDFTARLGSSADALLTPVAIGWLGLGGLLLAIAAGVASFELFRRRGLGLLARATPAESERLWLEGYVIAALVAAFLVFAASPTTPMSWQALPLLPVSIVPVAWAVARRSEPKEKSLRRLLLPGLAVVLVGADLLLAFGSPQFRCGGRSDLRFPLRAHSPMFDQLGIQERCPWPLGVAGGWWPDVLPDS